MVSKPPLRPNLGVGVIQPLAGLEICNIWVTTQVDRLKTVRKKRKTAHFEAMFGAKIKSFRRSTAIELFNPFSLQSKQLQPDYVSSYLELRF